MTDEILTVHQFAKDTDGELVVRCPHCSRIMGVEGPVRGEQYQDRLCGGWLEVSFDARRISDTEEL